MTDTPDHLSSTVTDPLGNLGDAMTCPSDNCRGSINDAPHNLGGAVTDPPDDLGGGVSDTSHNLGGLVGTLLDCLAGSLLSITTLSDTAGCVQTSVCCVSLSHSVAMHGVYASHVNN